MFNRLRHSSGDSSGRASPTQVRGHDKSPAKSSKQNTQTHARELQARTVQVIEDDQPYNPYTEIQILSHHTDIIRILLKIDATRCVSAGDDCLAVIWDVQLGAKLFVLSGHSRPITCMLILGEAIHEPDEDLRLLTGASDKCIIIWNVLNGTCLQKLTEHNSSVKSLVRIDGTDFFCSGGEKLCLWNNERHLTAVCDRINEEADIHTLINISRQRLVSATDKQLVVYGLSENKVGEVSLYEERRLRPHRDSIRAVVALADKYFASGSIDGTIVLWSMADLTPTREFNTVPENEYKGNKHRYPYSVQYLAAMVDKKYLFGAIGCGFSIFNTQTGQLVAEKHNAHYSKIVSLQFVYEGALLATCSEDGCIRLWGKSPLSLSADDASSHSLLGLRNEHLNSNDELIELELLGECLGHSGAVQMVEDFGSEGMVSCGMDGLVIVWKDGLLQNMRRNEIVTTVVFGSNNGVM